jgi:hypothetical protein
MNNCSATRTPGRARRPKLSKPGVARKWVTGSMGQLVPNGMLTEIRQYNMLISQTLARIKIDFDSAANADLIKINRPNPQRAGANKRWRGAGA